MGYQKHSWLSYQRKGGMIEIILRDENGRKIDSFRCNNKKFFESKLAPIIANKYGWRFKDYKKEVKKKWLNKDMKW